MGHYGYDIMDSDQAQEMQEDYLYEIMSCLSIEEATKKMMKEAYLPHWNGFSDRIYVLTYLQLKGNQLHTTLKKHVLLQIHQDIKEGCLEWGEPEERIEVLLELKKEVQKAKEWGTDFSHELKENDKKAEEEKKPKLEDVLNNHLSFLDESIYAANHNLLLTDHSHTYNAAYKKFHFVYDNVKATIVVPYLKTFLEQPSCYFIVSNAFVEEKNRDYIMREDDLSWAPSWLKQLFDQTQTSYKYVKFAYETET